MAQDNCVVTNVMVDIETLGTKPGSIIASIGAVVFCPKRGIGDEIRELVDIESAQSFGLTIDAPTISWWFNQSVGARNALFDGYRHDLPTALSNFSSFLGRLNSPVRMWSHGPSFDLVLLEFAYQAANITVPWLYNSHRDTRTLFDIAGVNLSDYRVGTHHDALDDARSQARAAMAAMILTGFPGGADARAS